MEFKDKLKVLRMEKELTQAQLAEKLFVSRSTVAKWENGLGLPNPESMQQLADQFGVTKDDMSTTNPEAVIVEKNRRLQRILRLISWATMVALFAGLYMMTFAIHNGDYGFTPNMAAGSFADNEYFDTGDCRIYYFSFEGDWEDGQHWSDLQGFRIVKKHIWGCTVDNLENVRIITHKNYVVGRLYTIKGKKGYYNILHKSKIYKAEHSDKPMIWNIPAELICATSITIGGVEYPLEGGFFFITSEPVEYFKIKDQWYNIE